MGEAQQIPRGGRSRGSVTAPTIQAPPPRSESSFVITLNTTPLSSRDGEGGGGAAVFIRTISRNKTEKSPTGKNVRDLVSRAQLTVNDIKIQQC